jgi:hypothetical protein
MKGYPVISNRSQKKWVRHRSSGAFRNARWELTDTESNIYVLVGDEVERELKTIFRIVWKESYRDADRKVAKRQQHLADVQYWDVISDFRLYLQECWDGKDDVESLIPDFVFGWGDGRIDDPIYRLFTEDAQGIVAAKVHAKWDPTKERIVRDYLASEEWKVWMENEAMRRERAKENAEEQQEKSQRESHRESTDEGVGSISMQGMDWEMVREFIKAGFWRLSRKHHPDNGGNEETMKRVNVTHDALKKMFHR